MNRDQLIADIYQNMHTVRKGMFHRLQQMSGDLTASPAQLHLLFTIRQHQPINAKQLALKLQMTPGAISQLVDGLYDQQLIQRTPSLSDRRIQNLELTAKGQTSFTAMETSRRKLMEQAMQTLTDEELTIWLQVQRKLIDAFNNLEKN